MADKLMLQLTAIVVVLVLVLTGAFWYVQHKKSAEILIVTQAAQEAHKEASLPPPTPITEAPKATLTLPEQVVIPPIVLKVTTYKVVKGDTLWKVSKAFYGVGSQYMKVFNANTPLLKHQDKIYPGQVLTIPT